MVFDKVAKHYNKFMKQFNLYKINEIKEALNLNGEELLLDVGGADEGC